MIFTSTISILIMFLQNSDTYEPSVKLYRSVDYGGGNEELIDINQPDPKFLQVDEDSGCLCRAAPKILTVCFGRNNCTKMPTNITIDTSRFKLTNTHITTLGFGNFSRYQHLEALQIEGNFDLSQILPGTFNNLTNLTNLSVSFNPLLSYLDPDTFEGLTNLRSLFLIKNGFTKLHDVTSTLSSLHLPKLRKLSLNENIFLSVKQDDFNPMHKSNLKELNMVLCRLESLHPDSYTALKKLKILRLGENNFDAANVTAVINRITENNIPLKLLNLYSVGFRNTPPYKLLLAISKSNISHLTLSKNQFSYISSESFPYMPNIRVLYLREIFAVEISDNAFSNLTNLKTLLLSGNKFSVIPKGALVPTLRYLDLQNNVLDNNNFPSYFLMSGGIFANMSSLLYLNLNFNNIYHLFNGSFDGLNSLQVLNLKNASIYHIQNFTFSYLKHLLFLNLENNDFVRHNYPLGLSSDIFYGLNNLQVLMLGGCRISYLSLYGNPFIHLNALKHLSLSKNEIMSLSPNDLAPLSNLQFIDISFNLLQVWDERLFARTLLIKSIILHHNKLTYFTAAMLEDFSEIIDVELSYNSFICTCYTYKIFYQWSLKNPNNSLLNTLDPLALCVVPRVMSNISVPEYFRSVQNGNIHCDKENHIRLIAVLPLALLVLFFIILICFVYYYRWHIKYWIFLSRLYLSRKGKLQSKSEKNSYVNYTYDAFISYSNDDRNFVVRLISMLENYEPFFKLCVYERDFEVGSFISESILESVAKSRKTILIISDSYAKSVWCRWESQLAEHHRLFFGNENGVNADDTLIIIKIGPVCSNHMTPTLKYLLKTRIYLQWESDEQKQKVFWEKLRKTLSPPSRYSILSENTHM